MAQDLSEDQLASLKATFNKFDQNHDGFISAPQLLTVLEELRQDDQILPQQLPQALIEEVDLDGNGLIDFSEFTTMITQKYTQLDTETELIQAFKILDKDGNGFITRDQIEYFVQDMPVQPEIMAEMLKSVDLDGDGRISFQEFVKWMVYI